MHPPVYSIGSDGDPRWVIDLIDAEFDVPPDRIKEFQVQFRPYEETEIKGIALDPRRRAGNRPRSPNETPSRRSSALEDVGRDETEDADTDHDGLSDFSRDPYCCTDPNKPSTARDGVSDGDRQRRREFTYSIRSVVKVMAPVNLDS